MARAAVFVTRRVPEAGLAVLRQRGVTFDLHDSDLAMSPEALRAAAIGRRGLIVQMGDRIDAALLESVAATCRVVATVSVGFDHIDVTAARRLGIVVTHTPNVLTETMADLTWALMLATARRLGEAERDLRAGRWRGWGLEQYLGADVHGATLGIVGGGRIGSAVARRAAGFDMRVLCCTRRAEASAMPAGVRFVDLATLLRESDYVSLHVPLTDQTRRLIGAAELALMKRTAFLINTSRGPVVDEAALISALREGRLAGAGLDVYENEPHVPAELPAMEHVVLLPHIGSASRATREAMARMAAQSVAAVLAGGTAENEVRA
ncbi:MAG: D-glycerate dehydrogenase [Phycisphaerae bacterium]|nr:D-glycerate dehydrogenase [Phycisphaerae bacterium]NUQ47913.1 D-glycerate dehydrogenase [Phycisphaerae bacterium]